VDVRRPLQDRVRSLCGHEVEDAVNDLISRKPEERCAQDLLTVPVHQKSS